MFDSGKGLWRLYRGGLGLQFVFTSAALGTLPYQMASFSQDFTEGEVSLRREVFADRLPLYPLQYPLDELVMVHLLARGRGVAIHGSGVVDADGRGTLFAGQSGAGKTTMARLWLPEPGVKILSDERVVLRQEGDVVWMYGTPWHGDGRISNQGRAPLDRICFLRHAPRNQMTRAGADRVDRAPLLLLLPAVLRRGRPGRRPRLPRAHRRPLPLGRARLRPRRGRAGLRPQQLIARATDRVAQPIASPRSSRV